MFMGLRIENSNFQAEAKWDRGGSVWMYANNALQIWISTSFQATREAEDSKYLTSTHLHPATPTRMWGAGRCECTTWCGRSFQYTQVMQDLRQLDSFRLSLTLVHPSSASLVVNQFNVWALTGPDISVGLHSLLARLLLNPEGTLAQDVRYQDDV